MGLQRRRAPRELAYAEVTATATPTSTSYADLVGASITFTAGDRPILVRAWTCAPPSNSTAGNGGKIGMVRTDTGAVIGEHAFVSATANAPGGAVSLSKRLVLAPGTTLTVKLQVAQRGGATCTFGATVDQPIALQAVELEA